MSWLSDWYPICRSIGAWEEGAADFLVNTKLGMDGFTDLLARLENLSHILAWSERVSWFGDVGWAGMFHRRELCFSFVSSVEMVRIRSEVDGKGGVYRIELPRLSLSFTRSDDGRFFCDQLAGHWNLRQKLLKLLSKYSGRWTGASMLKTYWSGLDADVNVYTLGCIE